MKISKKVEKIKKEFKKKIRNKYNCSWARFLIKRVEENNWMNNIAIFYRGTKITFKEMFDNAFKMAASMKTMGIQKGMEIPMCLSNCPETIYTLLAASLIGAKINVFGIFDKDYIEEIINGTDAKILFVTDDVYKELEDIIPNTNIKKTVLYSLTDSYPNGKNPYYSLEKEFYDGKNNVSEFKKENSNILDKAEFLKAGENYTGQVEEESTLDDIFSITYSSGSTNAHRPKAIMHRVRSFNTMGVAHEGGDTPKMKDITTLVQIPTHSNTCLISSISDTLSQGCTCALEYIYNQFFFPISMQINKPNLAEATRSFWTRLFKEYDYNPKYKNVDLKFLIAPFAVGEPTSPGEEKYLNKSLRKYKAGTDVTHTPMSVITMCMGGGDCEHGGIFIIMFKSLMEKSPLKLLSPEPLGYHTFKMVDYAVLDEFGNHCKPYEYGTLAATSDCDMVGYKNNEDATNEFFVQDSQGKTFGNCNTYSYIDFEKRIHIKGRVPKDKEKEQFPAFLIQDEIQKDTKNILSCEVVKVEDTYVAHIELQPETNIRLEHLMFGIESHLMTHLPESISKRVVIKIRDFKNSFPLTNCGKRSAEKLKAESLEGSYRLIAIDVGIFDIVKAEDYINQINEEEKILSLNK